MSKKQPDYRARIRAAREPQAPLDYSTMHTLEIEQCIEYLEAKVSALEIPEVAAWVRGRLAEANLVLESRRK